MFTDKDYRQLAPTIGVCKVLFFLFSTFFLAFLCWRDIKDVLSRQSYPTKTLIANYKNNYPAPNIYICSTDGNITSLTAEVFDLNLGGVDAELSKQVQSRVEQLDPKDVANLGDWIATKLCL
jgi:hypothetical protein